MSASNLLPATIIVLICATSTLHAYAAPETKPVKKVGATLPDDLTIEDELLKVQAERAAVFEQAAKDARRLQNPFPSVPTPERSGIDVEQIARRYEAQLPKARADGVIVFASFSMPREALKRLLGDASRVGATVVLRGFKNGSLKETGLAVQSLDEPSAGVQINPQAFEKYRITGVPAVVVVKGEGAERLDSEGCALPEDFVKVSGDIPLGYSLEHIARHSPAFAAIAASYGQALAGGAK